MEVMSEGETREEVEEVKGRRLVLALLLASLPVGGVVD